ncbi:hypothetical protein SKAU_G00280400 [Synaphobranchus kaupii]|uniref:Uncharacterized protein n=1 Tax=Synaphobranchus kaupii TaxID=118154 RepID=A0A9Q1EWX2_SYNKA|nr:hypothetical protein SKAU_G00280400 [Synaphobranchus kaupii]
MCGMSSNPDSSSGGMHRELEKAEITKSEAAVQRVMKAFTSCFMNPWCVPDKTRLYNIASGAPVTQEVEGWEKNEEGVLEPMWTAGPIMPPSLVDLLVKEADNIEHENNEEEEEQDETIEDDLNDDEDY